jgi:hypothetical protein
VIQPDETGRLRERFAAEAAGAVPLTALWAHGSLALGDYQPGRSDLDLIALIETAPAPAQQDDLQRVHQALHDQVPLAQQLHCTYVARAEWAGPSRDHLAWAHGELFARPVTPVSRRELHLGGLVLRGPAPATVVPRSPTRSSPTSSAPTCGTTGTRIPNGPTCGCATSGWTSGC